MDAVLKSVLAGQTENYLLPFFWLHEGHDAELPTQIQKIAESGCRAFCVESRPYEHFCEEAWWKTMNIVLREAQKRQMRVWILDDKHFPTGYANGILAHSEPSLRRRFLREFHVDVMGPAKDITLLMPQFTSEEQLLTVVMYRRTGREEELTGKPIVLNAKKEDKFVYLDVPEGCWRVFYVSASFTRANSQTDYIDMLSQESVHKLIEAVYEPHYAYYAPLFGNTIAGFFSDEPRFDAQHVGYIGYDSGIYQRTVGQPGGRTAVARGGGGAHVETGGIPFAGAAAAVVSAYGADGTGAHGVHGCGDEPLEGEFLLSAWRLVPRTWDAVHRSCD